MLKHKEKGLYNLIKKDKLLAVMEVTCVLDKDVRTHEGILALAL
jgi:hypothetical protein